MSTDDTIEPADGGNILAAEYVLGVLGADERREVERRLALEPALLADAGVSDPSSTSRAKRIIRS